MILSEEDHQKCAKAALYEIDDYRKRNVTKWIEIIIVGLKPRSRTILAEIMPTDLYVWVGKVSPESRQILDESLAARKA